MPKLRNTEKKQKTARKTKTSFFVTSKVLDKLIAAEIEKSFEETAFTMGEFWVFKSVQAIKVSRSLFLSLELFSTSYWAPI